MLILPICNNYSTSSTSGGLWHQRLFFLAWEIHFSCFFFNGKIMQVQRELITQNCCKKPSPCSAGVVLNLVYSTFFLWVLRVHLDFPVRWGSKANSERAWCKWDEKKLSIAPCLDSSALDLMIMIWDFLINSDCIFSTEFHLWIDRDSGWVRPLLSHGSVWFLGLIFFFAALLKINLMTFFFHEKSSDRGALRNPFSAQAPLFSCFIFQEKLVWFFLKLSFHFQQFLFLTFVFPGAKRALLSCFPSWGAYSQ